MAINFFLLNTNIIETHTQLITIGLNDLSLSDFERIVFENAQVDLSTALLEETSKSHLFLIDFCKEHIVYGVNTGFGPMAQHIIPNEDRVKLQYNLIRSHASGQGELFSNRVAKAIMLARLISLSKAYSGIHPDTLKTLIGFINNNITPSIYLHGGVGASGDLVQLAHLALNLIGEGKVRYNGKEITAGEAIQASGVNKLEVYMREGLSLINGTSAMTGSGLVNVVLARKLLKQSIMMSAMLNEITEAYDDHHSCVLNEAKKHKSQTYVADNLREILNDSKRIKTRYASKNLRQNGTKELNEKMQEFYSIRCVPQVIGPIKETIDLCEEILLRELNSANDNPIVDYKSGNVYHGGNFHGDYVSLEMDKLKIAITKLTMLCERQINFLMNHKINEILPPFLNMGRLGFNFGMQGIQFTATSTTAESQTLSNPMYVHSITTNNDNQDIVSMGCNSASIARKVIDNSFEVMSIGLAAACQAIDCLKIESYLSTQTKAYYHTVRSIVPVIDEDIPHYESISQLINHLKNSAQ